MTSIYDIQLLVIENSLNYYVEQSNLAASKIAALEKSQQKSDKKRTIVSWRKV